MGKKGSSQPPAPNPADTARAEAQFNRQDTYGPSGSGVRYGYTDANGNFVQGTVPPDSGYQSAVSYQESDFEQQLRSLMEPAATNLTRDIIGNSVNKLPGPAQVRDRSDVAGDIFNRNFSLMAPAIDRSNSRLLSNLQARGIPIGGDAFNEAYGDQLTRTQDTISRMAMDSNVQAGQEQSREYALEASQRDRALAEIAGLMGQSYAPASATPQGANAGVNYSGMVNQKYQSDMDAWQTGQQNQMQTAGALGSLGAALIKSTVRAKDVEAAFNSEFAALVIKQLPLKLWRYKAGEGPDGDTERHVGPMAEDFHQMTGLGTPNDISIIDYLGMLTGALQVALWEIEKLKYMTDGQQVQ